MTELDTLVSLLRAVTPDDIHVAMGLPKQFICERGVNYFQPFSTADQAISDEWFERLMERSVDAAVRITRKPTPVSNVVARVRDETVRQYLKRLVHNRNRFAARAWARIGRRTTEAWK